MGEAAPAVGALVVSFVAAALLSGAVRRYALDRGILDHSSVRSSHTGSVPRGGGVGVLAGVLLGLAWAAARGSALRPDLVLPLAGVLLVAAVGWRDDRVGLGVGLRLSVHAVGALCVLPLVLAPPALPEWMGLAAGVWWLVWAVSSINVVNFMDGIDGLIASQAAIFGVHLSLVSQAGASGGVLGLVLVGASLGFLLWNWAPAKIFLGDVGSGSLGLLMVAGGALAMRESGVGFSVVFLPLYPLFLDATSTLLLRAARGEDVRQAHRAHLYQKLANGGWGHRRVSVLYGAVALAGVAVAAAHDARDSWGAVLAYSMLVLLLGAWLRGRRGDRSSLRSAPHEPEETRP
jgi:UDP-N-acetylmuramyl pentapeptide phosphotransferase/UDP-N-acetylglucosamine-1-phosphate transferase